MTVLVDTSALYALLDEDDRNHAAASKVWSRLLDQERLATHTYVVVESSALIQRRLGMGATAQLHDGLLAPLRVIHVDRRTHDRAVARWRQARNRRLSLVDVASFELMELNGIQRAFAFDQDFQAAGFSLAT